MNHKHHVTIALGGSNIKDRMLPLRLAYEREETPVVMFVGRIQGPEAIGYFQEWGIPCYSGETGKGYVVGKNDHSATTLQNAIVARKLVERLELGTNICISTEFHHGKRALRGFKRIFPKPYEVDLVTVGRTITNLKELAIRLLHESFSVAFDFLYVDLPREAKSDKDVFEIYSRDKILEKVIDKLRSYESRMFMAVGSESENELIGTLVDKKGNVISGQNL